MEPQVSLDCDSCLHPESLVSEDGGSGVTTSLQDHAATQQPMKKQTRQWAAWTHQEEESFFSALRQVGKNFEKITSRVQSKNKDQVRHYYYRLVRRMNKLLGPELCLDAKNSKDTNAAMLRWWSLLEKYSCKASKLHLKPRRFKLFVETLENQLLKDKKKNVKKRPTQGENSSITTPTTVSNQARTSIHENCAVKAVLIDSQNIQKFGMGKGSSLKRHINIGINRSNYKADSSSLKTSRHRRKTVAASTAAYKRWEKAAIAGVSLVADAAEHLERTSTDKEVEGVQDAPAENGFDYCEKDVPSLPNSVQNCMKLKLQLFPVDESTRRALETDNHNPHLELTLSTRKKISSVLEHLNRKWGDSSVASGELMLLPYCVLKENLVSCDKWTKDSTLSAADIYTLIGSPPVFRLRYGWYCHVELGPVATQAPLNEQIVDSIPKSIPYTFQKSEKLLNLPKDCTSSATQKILTPSSPAMPNEMNGCPSTSESNISQSSVHASAFLFNRRESETGTAMQRDEIQDDSRMQKSNLSAGEWADSLTNISVGDLLSEASLNVDTNCIGLPDPRNPDCLQQIPFSSDSFDAAIAAHIFKHQSRAGSQPPLVSHASSLWDAEETCDAFSFQKNAVFSQNFQNASRNTPETFGERARGSSAASGRAVEELSDTEKTSTDDPVDGDMDKCQSDHHTSDSSMTDLNGITDLYWPDSLGPLDLDIPSCRYHSDDMILSDSLGGLNRLIASSLDAFQNCSFFGSEKKESATAEAGETAPVSDLKIGTEV